MTRLRSITTVFVLAALAVSSTGCGGRYFVKGRVARDASVSIVVYDRFTGDPLPGVFARVVAAEHEWSSTQFVSPFVDVYRLTDGAGAVYFDAFDLADYDVGFQVDRDGRAIILPDLFEDEVLVTIELFLPGEPSLLIDVELDYYDPSGVAIVDY